MIYRSAAGREAVADAYRDWMKRLDRPLEASRIKTHLGHAHSLVVGEGDGPAIVALAGTNFPAVASAPLLGLADRGHRVFAVDLVGQPGRSEGRRLEPSSPEMVRWLEEVVDGLGLPTVHLVGHSLGGHVALHFAAARARRVRRLVLICPSGLMRLRVPARVLVPTLAWLARPGRRSSRALLRQMSEPGGDVEDLVPWMTAVGRHVRTSLAPRPLPASVLDSVERPVLVIAGERDPFLPGGRLAATVGRRMPQGETIVVPGGSHLLPHDRPAEILRLVGDFLAGEDAAGPAP